MWRKREILVSIIEYLYSSVCFYPLHITFPQYKMHLEHSDLVLWGHYVPGAGDSSWVILLRPVWCFETPRGFVQPASTVLLTCGAMIHKLILDNLHNIIPIPQRE